MQRVIMILLLAMSWLGVYAQYSVQSASNGVKIKSGMSQKAATAGTQLRGSDVLVIPAGGKVEVLNTANKKIFSSTTTGEVSVFDLVMSANKAAGNHAGTVARRLNFGKAESKNQGKVFKETGMVRRSLAVYDPDGQSMEMDAVTLGRMLAAQIAGGDTIHCNAFPVTFEHSKNTGIGLFFNVENTLDYPVYFNIVKVVPGAEPTVEISRIGQPTGCYVLLPEQSMSRRHNPMVDAAERHILIMAPCQFDIDQVMDEMKQAMKQAAGGQADASLPVFAGEI